MLVNINTATASDIEALGFVAEWAKYIIDSRDYYHGFSSSDDLRKLQLSEQDMNTLISNVTFSDQPVTGGFGSDSLSDNINNALSSTNISASSTDSTNNATPKQDETLLASNEPNFNQEAENVSTQNASDTFGTGTVKPGYWEGWTQAKIELSQISCSWPNDHVDNRIKFINDVFAFWYGARNSNSPEQPEINDILDKAGTEGWDDLKDVFTHLEKSSGYWSKYCDLSTYWGGQPNSLFYANPLDVPVPLKNFTDVIEKNLEPLNSYCTRFYSDTGSLESAVQTSDWSRIKDALEQIHTWSGRAKKFLWMYPKSYQMAKKTSSYSEALINIHDSLTIYANSGSAAIASLQYAVTFVPVLGSYYKAMVEMIPNAQNWFQDVIDVYCRRIDAAAAGHP